MDEVLQQPTTGEAPAAEGDHVMQEAMGDRAKAMDAVAQARENLGQVASRPIVLASGEVTTQKAMEEERQYRRIHGEPSTR